MVLFISDAQPIPNNILAVKFAYFSSAMMNSCSSLARPWNPFSIRLEDM
jgi:hypothetical protein